MSIFPSDANTASTRAVKIETSWGQSAGKRCCSFQGPIGPGEKHANPQRLDVYQVQMHLTTDWMVGFVDGEGCFTIRVSRHPTRRLGYQVQPSFQITQHVDDRQVLERCKAFFQCGRVREKGRGTLHSILDYRVERLEAQREIILPFFEAHKLKTRKRQQFEIYRDVVRILWERRQNHQPMDVATMLTIVEQALRMNLRAKNPKVAAKLLEVRENLKQQMEELQT